MSADTVRVVKLPATSYTVRLTTVGVDALADSALATSVNEASLVSSASPDGESLAVNACDREVLRQVVFVTFPGVTTGPLLSTMKVRVDVLVFSHVAEVA